MTTETDVAGGPVAPATTTPAGPAGGPGDGWRTLLDRLRPWWPVTAVALVILGTAALIAPSPDAGLPLDPDSTAADGTRALGLVLGRVGREVAVATPDDLAGTDGDVVLLLRDQLDDAGRDALRARVRAGARLVVADPGSPLAPPVAGAAGLLARSLDPGCAVPALDDVDAISPGGGAVYDVPGGATGCFPTGAGAWLVVRPLGAGHVVALGGPQVLVNGALDEADHDVLAVTLLAPRGGDRVVLVRPVLRTATGDGDRSLADLLPGWLRVAAGQLLLAFLVLVVVRARRLGAPLVDTSPVRLDAAEQTRAVGALLARHATRDAALQRLADDARRRAATHLGLPAAAPADEVAAAVADRTGVPAARAARILAPSGAPDDAALLRAAAALTALDASLHAATSDPAEPADVH